MNVWVTREEDHTGPLCTALRAAGLNPVREPVIERHLLDDCAHVLSTLGPDDWLVLTSPYAVESVAAEYARVPRVAAVADASRDAAVQRSFRVELVSPTADGAGLWKELKTRATRGKVCYPRSSLARPPQPWPGVELLSPILYETAPREFDGSVIDRIDVVSVASPSAVNAIGPIDKPFASIGPTTSAALRNIGIEPWIESPRPDFTSLANAIAMGAPSLRNKGGGRSGRS